MAKLVFKNQKFYLSCDHSQREIVKKAGFKWCNTYKLWFTEDEFKASLLIELMGEKLQVDLPAHIIMQLNTHFDNKIISKRDTWEPYTYLPTYFEELAPFQKFASYYMARVKQNWLLGDEPGLGKTAQAISVMNERIAFSGIKNFRCVVICPASLKLNWKKEILEWARKDFPLFLQIISSKNQNFDKVDNAIESIDIKIINYDLLSPANCAALRQFKPDLLIIDEAQYLKNRESDRTKKVLLSKDALVKYATQTLALTGTPVTKLPTDIWPLCKALFPAAIMPYLSYWDFSKQFCKVIDKPFGKEIVGSKNEEELNLRLRSTFMIRRTKQQVLGQLPAKRYQIITLEKNAATAPLLKKEKELPRAEIDFMLKKHTVPAGSHIATLRRELSLAKVPQAIEFIADQLASEEKIVVFVWHKDALAQIYAAFKPIAVAISGDTANSDRQKAVDEFQNNPNCRVFIGNIQAAGVGITLTAASRVIFVESSWLPADIEQAIDRCHRIGQKDSVLAQFLVVEDSIDANILNKVIERVKSINKII